MPESQHMKIFSYQNYGVTSETKLQLRAINTYPLSFPGKRTLLLPHLFPEDQHHGESFSPDAWVQSFPYDVSSFHLKMYMHGIRIFSLNLHDEGCYTARRSIIDIYCLENVLLWILSQEIFIRIIYKLFNRRKNPNNSLLTLPALLRCRQFHKKQQNEFQMKSNGW